MTNPRTIIIAGSGPSACQYEWPDDVPIMAVSSGYRDCPRIDHFCTLDPFFCFPEWLTDSTRFDKHIPNWRNAKEWRRFPRVREYEYEAVDIPRFARAFPISAGGLRKSNVDDIWHNSLIFAAQVAPRLGCRRCIFIGVDLLGPMRIVSEYLKTWYPIAQQCGIEWQNASPLSSLCEWMPNADKMMEVAA